MLEDCTDNSQRYENLKYHISIFIYYKTVYTASEFQQKNILNRERNERHV
jgi:hypothetical protein